MILIFVHHLSTAGNIVESGVLLANRFSKQLGIYFANTFQQSDESKLAALDSFLKTLNLQPDFRGLSIAPKPDFSAICQQHDASFLMIQLSKHNNSQLQNLLNGCRELRIPYLFFKDVFHVMQIRNIIVPVNFLIEEIEKAQFAAAFGRFFGARITLLQSKDYGSKARTNVRKILTVLKKFDLESQLVEGKKDSFKIEFEAIHWSGGHPVDMILISASRDYGLDDVLFGPKERHLIKKSPVPLLIINPRADLYVLCD